MFLAWITFFSRCPMVSWPLGASFWPGAQQHPMDPRIGGHFQKGRPRQSSEVGHGFHGKVLHHYQPSIEDFSLLEEKIEEFSYIYIAITLFMEDFSYFSVVFPWKHIKTTHAKRMFPLNPPFLNLVSIKSTISRGCSIASIQFTGGCQIGCSLPPRGRSLLLRSPRFTLPGTTGKATAARLHLAKAPQGCPVLGSVWKFGTMWDEKVGRLGKWWFNQQKWGFHGSYSWIILIMIVQLAHLSWSCFGLRANGGYNYTESLESMGSGTQGQLLPFVRLTVGSRDAKMCPRSRFHPRASGSTWSTCLAVWTDGTSPGVLCSETLEKDVSVSGSAEGQQQHAQAGETFLHQTTDGLRILRDLPFLWEYI